MLLIRLTLHECSNFIDGVDFPAFVAELMEGVFKANVDGSFFTDSFHYASGPGRA